MRKVVLAAIVASIVMPGIPARAVEHCRLALALGLDVSGSVDDREYRLQLDGLARALETIEVQQAVFAAPDAVVALAIYEWGGLEQQRLLVDWTMLRSPEDLQRTSRTLRATSGIYSDPATAIRSAILYGVELLSAQPTCWQRTLDISGDGPANIGGAPGLIPDTALEGVTVNGLVVAPNSRANTTKNLRNVKTLSEYYETEVIRGPNAFVESASDFRDFERAMTRKLTRELQELTLSQSRTAPILTDTPLQR